MVDCFFHSSSRILDGSRSRGKVDGVHASASSLNFVISARGAASSLTLQNPSLALDYIVGRYQFLTAASTFWMTFIQCHGRAPGQVRDTWTRGSFHLTELLFNRAPSIKPDKNKGHQQISGNRIYTLRDDSFAA